MATRQGQRYGEEKPVQRNVETKDPEKPNRSPGQSNANRRMPSLREDVGISTQRDVERVQTGRNPTGRSALTQTAQREAGVRAASRLAGRAGYVGSAFGLGLDIGEGINKQIDKMAEGKVKLSEYAKKRLKEESDFEDMSAALRKADEDIEKEKKSKKMAVGGMPTKMTPKQQTKVGKVMKEFKAGSLHSGKGGKVVTKPRQAVAIAMSEARRMKKK